MTQSTSNITPTYFELSPCRVTYKGVDLGGTLGNVVVKITDTLSDIYADQMGKTVIDKRVSAHKFTTEFSIAEVQNKDNWKILFPPHKLVSQSGQKGMYFDSEIGYSMISQAGVLNFHPLSKPNTDLSEDFTIYLAAGEVSSDFTFSPTEQVKMKLVMDMYPDFTSNPPRFFFFGDPSIGLIPATVSAATAGTGNIGNGTITGQTAFSSTKTEVITAKCVTAATTFFVSGSQSGALGLATVGVTFNSNVVAFNINGGGTPFAVNDSFTMTTTSANYG